MALPYVRSMMNIVGFWFKNDMHPEYDGSLPRDENVVPANVTWIIRWKDREHRDKVWEEFQSEEWQRILSTVPGGPESYLRTEAKFAEEI